MGYIMGMKTDISITELAQLLRFDPELGLLTWLPRPRHMFTSDKQYGTWNTRFANKQAFTHIGRDGYYCGCIHGSVYKTHRVGWTLYHGEWPADYLDHINGVRTDNRIENLRSVTRGENSKNRRLYKKNNTGHNGISWRESTKKWIVQIQSGGTKMHLGVFTKLDDAVAARLEADVTHDFHPNHGN
jgi:hypothetical protein